MRFRPWPKPEPYRDTSRKRAAFKRKQRLEREALPLFADMIAAGQHSVDEEMARRHVWWDEREREQRTLRAARWREARARLFALSDDLRSTVRKLWRHCPYTADPTYLLDLLHQIKVIASTRIGHPGFSTASSRRAPRRTPRNSTKPSARSAIARSEVVRRPHRPTSSCSAAISVRASCSCAPACGSTTRTKVSVPPPAIGYATPMLFGPVTGSILKSVATARMRNSS